MPRSMRGLVAYGSTCNSLTFHAPGVVRYIGASGQRIRAVVAFSVKKPSACEYRCAIFGDAYPHGCHAAVNGTRYIAPFVALFRPPPMSDLSVSAAPQPVRFAQALAFWLKLGFISFGGPAGQIAIMHTELVERRRWISEKRFLHALNYCMLLPGPEAQQLATYIGWLMHRTWGGIVAGALFVLPSLFILMGLSWVYLRFGDVPAVAGIFYGIKPAVTALVLHAAHRIGTRALRNRWMWGIAAAAFVAIFGFATPFPAIVLAAGLLGYFGARRWPQVFSLGGGSGAQATGFGRALIDDDTPTPAHARFSRRHLARVLGAGLGLWRWRWRAWCSCMAGRAHSRRWAGSSPRPHC